MSEQQLHTAQRVNTAQQSVANGDNVAKALARCAKYPGLSSIRSTEKDRALLSRFTGKTSGGYARINPGYAVARPSASLNAAQAAELARLDQFIAECDAKHEARARAGLASKRGRRL